MLVQAVASARRLRLLQVLPAVSASSACNMHAPSRQLSTSRLDEGLPPAQVNEMHGMQEG